MSTENKAWWLGLLGVFIFSLTLPMTRLATGSVDSPQLDGWFIAFGRACVGGILSLGYVLLTGETFPQKQHFPRLAVTSFCVVFGFPILISIALRHVEAIHASILFSGLPLATAIIGSILQKQKPSWLFWLLAVIGCTMIIGYIFYTNPGSKFAFQLADILILLGMISAAVGYVYGAKLSTAMSPQSVICWVLVIALPINILGAIFTFPAEPIKLLSWLAFIYLGVFSMWLGFFAWYRGLKMGGTIKISQIQLLQPFLSVLAAIPILGEKPDMAALVFAAGILLVVYFSKKTTVKY